MGLINTFLTAAFHGFDSAETKNAQLLSAMEAHRRFDDEQARYQALLDNQILVSQMYHDRKQ